MKVCLRSLQHKIILRPLPSLRLFTDVHAVTLLQFSFTFMYIVWSSLFTCSICLWKFNANIGLHMGPNNLCYAARHFLFFSYVAMSPFIRPNDVTFYSFYKTPRRTSTTLKVAVSHFLFYPWRALNMDTFTCDSVTVTWHCTCTCIWDKAKSYMCSHILVSLSANIFSE